jgi:hypothetical protein
LVAVRLVSINPMMCRVIQPAESLHCYDGWDGRCLMHAGSASAIH